MSRAFAFRESQPVIVDDERGLPAVGVYPAGVGFRAIEEYEESGERWVTVELPDLDDSFESDFPVRVGEFVDSIGNAEPERISLHDAAKRFPALVDAEMIEEYERAEASME
ncbi:hypothetical protein PTQ19_11920 [Microbacterium esteraromaticum]|uniref:hypothetical protein n=1 Tax=Microbacterium esteraromaticum TaxID=57043 RepID=UPI00236799B8|nr:hypothetical protein [Microbacterium esteraromaticum]WDH78218.1 hypothetical protein PTQ19_11920 [Microbacterium esteraromaticum]